MSKLSNYHEIVNMNQETWPAKPRLPDKYCFLPNERTRRLEKVNKRL